MTKIPDASFQGTRGAFSELAAWNLLSESAVLQPCLRLRDVFESVQNGEVQCGVIPMKNTLATIIRGSFDLWIEYPDLYIVGETVVHIEHAIIGTPGTNLEQVRRIFSHPVALAQCERFFLTHPEIQPLPEWDTAGSVAKVIRENLLDAAAIAGARTADIYQGEVLAEKIQDDPDNFTRFRLISKTPHASEIKGLAKTTIMIDLENKSRQIYDSIKPFSERDINIAEIENRQLKGQPFTYRFYLDLESTHEQSQALAEGLEELRQQNRKFRILGTYPAYQAGTMEEK